MSPAAERRCVIPTMSDDDVIPGLDHIGRPARERPASPGVRRRRRHAPSPRVLTLGGAVLRVAGCLVVIAGCWPLLLAILRAWIIVGGESPSHAIRFRLADGRLWLEANGWPEVAVSLLVAGAIWCVAIVTFAPGHALYALRDLAVPSLEPVQNPQRDGR